MKPLIISIEDDPNFRKAIESVLSRLGLHVKSAANSADFFALAEKMKPDVYLVDLQLEEESGFDVILRIRKEFGKDQPVVVLSGEKDVASIEKALMNGANDFITKPLDRMFLVSKLSRYVTTPEIEEQKSTLRAIPPGGRARGKLTFSAEVTEIDELGVRLRSRVLITTGTVLKLSAAFLLDLGISSRECLVTATTSWFDPDSQFYGIYAEFDGVDLQFLESVRHYLSSEKVAEALPDRRRT